MTAQKPTSRTLACLILAAVACALVWPLRAAAQQRNPPLAEVARREAERRKGMKDAPKVITTKDLPDSARKPRPAAVEGAASGEQAATPAAGGAPKTDAAPTDQKDETYWRTRMSEAQESLRRNESFLAALQSQVNGLTTDFVNRDDPYQRAKIGEARQKALMELERVKADIELAKKQIADVEEEARKAGAPPGWLR